MAEPKPVETADGSRTLFSEEYHQSYGSRHGALSEARHVFLEGSGVGERLRGSQPTRVLEVGFGTGLSFFVTARAALDSGTPLRYVALERNLLLADTLELLGYEAIAPDLVGAYLSFRRSLPPAPSEGVERFGYGVVELELRLGDASRADLEPQAFHAVYHDAFSPDANPELWSPEFLARLAGALLSGGALASYTVKGEVRRALEGLGLLVSKRPGPPGGKREVLLARKEGAIGREGP